MRHFVSIGIVLLLLWWPIVGSAQAPDPGEYSKPIFEVEEVRGLMVEMRDGVEISVDIYQPRQAGEYPSLLTMTPYDNAGKGIVEESRWFAKRGYIVVAADVRGRYDSGGEWDPFGSKHKTDGYDLVEWIAEQSWSTGKVGMIGASYMGWTQWWTASTAPPHLVAIAPKVAPPDHFYNVPYQHGVLTRSWFVDWAAGLSGRTAQTIGDGPYSGWSKLRPDFPWTPYIEINQQRGLRSAPWFQTWYTDNLSSAAYWRDIAYQTEESYSRITVPSLAFTGWFDANHPGSPKNYIGMKKYGATAQARRPSLVIGPWVHGINQRVAGEMDYGPDAIIDVNGYIVRWFDHYLKGIDNGVVDDPPVYVFVMGENAWHAAEDWPLPQTRFTKYYFQSAGRANSLKGNGTLTLKRPATVGHDTYIYDPLEPTNDPFDSSPKANGHIVGALDTRLSAIGDEVLVYQTPPLDEAVEVTGPIVAKLFASTSARDTDWMVRLVDVHPDGYSAFLADGVIRAKSRDPGNSGSFTAEHLSEIVPDQIYEYTIQFWRGTGNLFQAGHRIRVEVSSSWYPYYFPNLNSGKANLATVSADEAVTATQKIYHGGDRASYILLPIIPERD